MTITTQPLGASRPGRIEAWGLLLASSLIAVILIFLLAVTLPVPAGTSARLVA